MELQKNISCNRLRDWCLFQGPSEIPQASMPYGTEGSRGALKQQRSMAPRDLGGTLNRAPILPMRLSDSLQKGSSPNLGSYKAFRHVENLFIQRFLFIHPRFVYIAQGSLLVVQ